MSFISSEDIFNVVIGIEFLRSIRFSSINLRLRPKDAPFCALAVSSFRHNPTLSGYLKPVM